MVKRMKIAISNDAIEWFEEEMDVQPGESIQFFARYGGASPLHDGFSLGVRKEEPDEIGIETVQDGVRYYIESRDMWFFMDHDLRVTIDPKRQELQYAYEKA